MASPNRFEISEQTHGANFAMYNFHSHSWYEIFYLQSGQCTFYIQDKTYLMKEGDIAVIPPDILHKTAYLAEVNKIMHRIFRKLHTTCYFHVWK